MSEEIQHTYNVRNNPYDPNEKILSWGDRGDRYKLIDLAGVGSRIELPGQVCSPTADELLEQKDVIVFGDRGGGGRTFTDWWKGRLDKMKEPLPWLSLSRGHWNEESIRGSGRENQDIAKIKLHAIRTHLSKMKPNEKTEQFFETFCLIKAEIAGALERINLIFYEPSALDDRADKLIGALRMVRDTFSFDEFPMHVLIVNSSEELFLNTLERSSYLPIARCYRLAYFNKTDIQKLTYDLFSQEEPIGMKVLTDIQKKTGGHPSLTQTLIRRIKHLRDQRKLRGPITLDQVNYCFRQMKASPPDVVGLWMNKLKAILNTKRELVPTFQAYVDGMTLGGTRFPPPINERSLMIGGWVGMLPDQNRWGILSDYHSHLGIKVLSELGSV